MKVKIKSQSGNQTGKLYDVKRRLSSVLVLSLFFRREI